MAPYFKIFVRVSWKADRESDKMSASMEKKIAGLEMGLLQQNIDIPVISLVVHTSLALMFKHCYDEAVKAKVADFGDKVEDSTFLDTRQNQVYFVVFLLRISNTDHVLI